MWGAFETVGGCEGQGNFTPLRGTEVVATPFPVGHSPRAWSWLFPLRSLSLVSGTNHNPKHGEIYTDGLDMSIADRFGTVCCLWGWFTPKVLAYSHSSVCFSHCGLWLQVQG